MFSFVEYVLKLCSHFEGNSVAVELFALYERCVSIDINELNLIKLGFIGRLLYLALDIELL